MAPDENKKVAVNSSTSGYNPTIQDNITMALIQNGGVKRIQKQLQERLDEAGWTENLRQYVERLFRSGEATTYDDALSIITKLIALQPDGEERRGTVHGNGRGPGVPDLVIPREPADAAAQVVLKEIRGIVKIEHKPGDRMNAPSAWDRYHTTALEKTNTVQSVGEGKEKALDNSS